METGVANTALDAMRLNQLATLRALAGNTQYSDARAQLLLMAATAASVPEL